MPTIPLPLTPCCAGDAPCSFAADLQRRLTAAEKERDELAASWASIAEGERRDLEKALAERDAALARLDVAQEGVRALAAETKNLLEHVQAAERALEEKAQRCEDLEACLGAAQDGYALGIKASQRAISGLFDSPVLRGRPLSATLVLHTLERLLPRTPQSSPVTKSN